MLRVTLVSPDLHLQYFPALYRVATGGSPLEVCIALSEILSDLPVELVQDRIIGGDLPEKTLHGASGARYRYDDCVLAVGSTAATFGIPGIETLSFGMRTVHEALRLKRHLHEIFTCDAPLPASRIVVVGGGATGVELAGELASYARGVSRVHGLDPSRVTIDLIEAMPRLLPGMPESVSVDVERRLRSLGVNVYCNRAIVREEVEELCLKDMRLKTQTVVWTAGVQGSPLLKKIPGLPLDHKGRVEVDAFLQAKECAGVFAIGDAAATTFSGMAQTAVRDGEYVGELIVRRMRNMPVAHYRPVKPAYAIPVGPKWAAVAVGPVHVTGRLGWYVRRIADLHVFLLLLPMRRALTAFFAGTVRLESCLTCLAHSSPFGGAVGAARAG